jgi:glycine dehydrogenase
VRNCCASQACALAVQALLANIAAMYGVYHGPDGLTEIATRVAGLARVVAAGAEKLGHSVARDAPFFDTVCITPKGGDAAAVCDAAVKLGMNFRQLDDKRVTISIDETTTVEDADDILKALAGGGGAGASVESLAGGVELDFGDFKLSSTFMQHKIFNIMKSEHDLLRYLKTLENRDMSLVHSMIPLGAHSLLTAAR